MDTAERSYLNFEAQVRKAFLFLNKLGFSEVEALTTLVRYRKEDVEVEIYHGRQSYEIGGGVIISGTRYAISEIIKASDSEAFKQFHYAMVTTPEGVAVALTELSSLMEHYSGRVLRRDLQFISTLEKQRKQWSEDYSLDVLARQLRPQAAKAFRLRDYATATNLYSRIQERLSPVELKKLHFSKRHI